MRIFGIAPILMAACAALAQTPSASQVEPPALPLWLDMS